MSPVIVIRPEPGNAATVAAAQALDLNAHGFPMFKVRPLPWDMPEADSFDALLIGSANAVRHGGSAIASFAGKPVYAVGETTARMARDAGLDPVATGEGGLQDLMGRLDPGHRRLLRLTGETRVDVTPPEGVTLDERTVYTVDPQPMPDQLGKMLQRPCLVLLHSAEAARHFAAACAERGIDRTHVALACIGERVAEAAGSGWQQVRSADKPSEKAMLALTVRMCEGDDGPRQRKTQIDAPANQSPTQDRMTTTAIAGGAPAKRTMRGQLLVALMAFALGAALMAWSVWRGYLGSFGPERVAGDSLAEETETEGTPPETDETASTPAAKQMKAVSTVEGRLAMLEDRFSRLNLQANAASGNAARAESLLVAFAARRMIDRGEPLRYLEDQLRLRFTNAQPRAVERIIEFGQNPVTIDELSARLDALAPRLAGQADNESFWEKAGRELSSLFVVRREPSSVMSPEARIERARVMLTAGKVPAAVEQVRLLPGAEAADRWIVDALRYEAVQKSLDLIETTAMLDPSRLQDAEGNQVDQPSPLATPAKDVPAKEQ